MSPCTSSRFAQDDHNSVVLARSGAGKSYFTKLEALRLLHHGVEVSVIDPEDVYRALAEATGGTHLGLGAKGVAFNPFDLPTDQGDEQALRLQPHRSQRPGLLQPPAHHAPRPQRGLDIHEALGGSGREGAPAPTGVDADTSPR